MRALKSLGLFVFLAAAACGGSDGTPGAKGDPGAPGTSGGDGSGTGTTSDPSAGMVVPNVGLLDTSAGAKAVIQPNAKADSASVTLTTAGDYYLVVQAADQATTPNGTYSFSVRKL